MKEIIPNIWAPVIVVVSLSLPGYLAAESVYSFLGLGIQPPASTWGILLSNASRFVTAMPSFFLIVAGSLVVVVLAFNLVGDALREPTLARLHPILHRARRGRQRGAGRTGAERGQHGAAGLLEELQGRHAPERADEDRQHHELVQGQSAQHREAPGPRLKWQPDVRQ